MSIREFLAKPHSSTWHEEAKGFLESTLRDRYGANGLGAVQLRTPLLDADSAPFAAIVAKGSPNSGGYGGTSFVMFASPVGAIYGLVVGTQGLAPDEEILTRPGHARFARSFAAWSNAQAGFHAWAKADPARIDQGMPASIKSMLGDWSGALRKYENVIYLVIKPDPQASSVEDELLALVDFCMRERDRLPLSAHRASANNLLEQIWAHAQRSITQADAHALLLQRRFVILQGPPGTGKTRMALKLLSENFAGRGVLRQFHPSTSYEQFIGGLNPVEVDGTFGFRPHPGILMKAAAAARASDAPYLLVLDEINRADLSRVLGEALSLFEPGESRTVQLPYDFGGEFGSSLQLPPNLFVIGTMNTSDRSIAIMDLAVRRRFAFADLWPDAGALAGSDAFAKTAFEELRQIFLGEGTDDALAFMPGQSYFIGGTPDAVRTRMRQELKPLLESYLAHGLTPSLASHLDAYLQWLETR